MSTPKDEADRPNASPNTIPLLPLRDIIVFPYMVVPLFVGREKSIAAIDEALPWYGLNALIHYLTPHGLEQFGGAAWGTRDVSQGPMELLLCLGQYGAARRVLENRCM